MMAMYQKVIGTAIIPHPTSTAAHSCAKNLQSLIISNIIVLRELKHTMYSTPIHGISSMLATNHHSSFEAISTPLSQVLSPTIDIFLGSFIHLGLVSQSSTPSTTF
jgi:hypothetical protein